jgi:hypothetical protein
MVKGSWLRTASLLGCFDEAFLHCHYRPFDHQPVSS